MESSSRSFKDIFATDIDLSVVGIETAMMRWFESEEESDGPPNIIWVDGAAGKDVLAAYNFLARYAGEEFASYWTFAIAPEYMPDQWSIGTLQDRGYGSIGSGARRQQEQAQLQQQYANQLMGQSPANQQLLQRALSGQIGQPNGLGLNQGLQAPAPAKSVAGSDIARMVRALGLIP